MTPRLIFPQPLHGGKVQGAPVRIKGHATLYGSFKAGTRNPCIAPGVDKAVKNSWIS